MNFDDILLENLKKCPYFETCNKNLCPLDLELYLRSGGDKDKCRWMREKCVKKIKKSDHRLGGKTKDEEFIAGGQIMPNGVLNFVPELNLKWLNRASQKRWKELKNYQ